MKRIVSGIMLALLFLSMLTLAFNIRPVKSESSPMRNQNPMPTFWRSPDNSLPSSINPSSTDTFNASDIEKMSDGSGNAPLICILVNGSIYDAVNFYVDRYVSDVERLGFNASVFSVNGAVPEDVRAMLVDAYSEGLIGCLLVGDIPWAWYEMNNTDPWGYEEFPIDLFYMDLDGVWTDIDSDGKYDQHTGDRNPEIWVGRIKASGMADNEVSLIQNYFDKNHDYRTGALSLPNRALIYIDDDWVSWSDEVDSAVGFIYGSRTLVSESVTTQAADYLGRLAQNWSLVHLMVHGWSGGHVFKVNDEWDGYVYSSDIRSTNPHAFFYNLYSCSNARYNEVDYVGGWYIFSDTYGVAAVSSTKTGGMWFFSDFYSNFRRKILGYSFQKWLENRVAEEDADPTIWYDKKWYYGMTILGDPTLSLTTTIVVPDDYPTIQGAINAANEGETIFVCNGTYYEHVIVNKSVSLIGENRSTTIVDGNGEGTVILVQGGVAAIAANISGFTIQNGEEGVDLHVAGKCILRDNNLENNQYNLVITNNFSFEFEETGLTQDIDSSNTVNGKPIYYWINERDKQIPGDAGFVALINSTNIAVRNLKLRENGYGLLMAWTNNSIIENVTTSDNVCGIQFVNCHNNTVYNNSATNNLGRGVELWCSSYNVLKNTNISESLFNFGISGASFSEYINEIDSSNTINGKPIYYVISQKDLVIDPSTYGEIGYLGIVNCTAVVVQNLSLTHNYQGLLFAYTNASLIDHVKISDNIIGIKLTCSSNNVIQDNTIVDNYEGIELYSLVEWAHKAHCCSVGNTIRRNTICGKVMGYAPSTGITILYTSTFNNTIYHNNFINNTWKSANIAPIWDSVPYNVWDYDYPSGGNYWSDYNGTDFYSGPYQNETGSDGIGDTPYVIDENNTDTYPLMGPFGPLTMKGENVTVFPTDHVGLIFENVTVEGSTTVNKSDIGPKPPSGFKLEDQYYDIETTATYEGKMTIRIIYDDSNMTQGEEECLQLMQWNETIQQWTNITTLVDIENNVIYGETSSLSMFSIITPLIHNIAITETISSKTVVGQGFTLNINVTVMNLGHYPEKFNVTLYANTSIIEIKEITLTSRNTTTLTFTWNTTDFDKGNYTIWVYAWPVIGETYTTDNNFTDGQIKVGIPGDVNGDGIVNMIDIYTELILRFMCKIGDPCCAANSDINSDGIINMQDIYIAIIHFMEIEP